MFSHRTIKPDPDALFKTYQSWKAGVDSVADVEGLYPTFVMKIIPKGAARVGRTNGIGNTWGLKEEPHISKSSYIYRSFKVLTCIRVWQFSTGWANARDDLRVTSWSQRLIEQQYNIHEGQGLASPFIYMGDAGE